MMVVAEPRQRFLCKLEHVKSSGRKLLMVLLLKFLKGD